LSWAKKLAPNDHANFAENKKSYPAPPQDLVVYKPSSAQVHAPRRETLTLHLGPRDAQSQPELSAKTAKANRYGHR